MRKLDPLFISTKQHTRLQLSGNIMGSRQKGVGFQNLLFWLFTYPLRWNHASLENIILDMNTIVDKMHKSSAILESFLLITFLQFVHGVVQWEHCFSFFVALQTLLQGTVVCRDIFPLDFCGECMNDTFQRLLSWDWQVAQMSAIIHTTSFSKTGD